MKPTNTVRGTLLRAARLLETKGWTKGAYARRANGKRCAPTDQDASCFCVAGACRAACGDVASVVDGVRERVLAAFRIDTDGPLAGAKSVGRWNDTRRSKREAIALLRKAARL